MATKNMMPITVDIIINAVILTVDCVMLVVFVVGAADGTANEPKREACRESPRHA